MNYGSGAAPMKSRSLQSDLLSALVPLIVHGIILTVFFLALTFLGPRAERTIRDFNLRVPLLTESVLDLSRWTVEYFYLTPLIFLPLLVVDGAVYVALRRTLRSPVWSILWSLLVFLAALALVGMLVLALVLPGARVWQSLFK
jgi:type II secretory pathway component PulF